MTPQYQSRDDLHTTTQNLADDPTLAEHNGKGLKGLTLIISEIIPLHFLKTCFCLESAFLSLLELQKSLLVSMIIKNRCLEYCYTKCGRWTFFGQWPPSIRLEMTCIPLHKIWQINLLWLMDPGSTSTKMTYIPVHKTWQMNLLWLMDPPQYQSIDDLHTTTQNLADEPTLANETPVPEHRWLAYHYTKLGRWTYLAWIQW